VATKPTPERWARFLDETSPGLTWLAASFLEWADLPPAARLPWNVTVSAKQGGEITALAAVHEDTGLLAVACAPGGAPPFIGLPQNVRRILGEPAAVAALLARVPELGEGVARTARRTVAVFSGDPGPKEAALRRARDDEKDDVQRLRLEAPADHDPVTPGELDAPMQRGLVWILDGSLGTLGMFRIEGASRRRVQVADAGVPPPLRRRGLGTRLLRGAAAVARSEYAGDAVLVFAPNEPAERAVARAGFHVVGHLDDVRVEARGEE
jgi:ribosomal protein S18 acetylase RimI-like enzyme